MPAVCAVVDLGAGSGRVMLARSDGERLEVREVHRFHGYAVERADGPRWDLAAILREVEAGLARVRAVAGRIDSVGVDGWGLDYALLDGAGRLMGEPFHYRHPRSLRGFHACEAPAGLLFSHTGSQILPINTVYQLADDVRTAPDRLRRAERLVMIADAVCHHLTGIARAELTLARTTGLLEAAGERWSSEVAAAIGLDPRLLGPLIAPGEAWGVLRLELGLGPVPVVAVAGHDTASAVTALSLAPDRGFLILGSWSLIGAETPGPDLRPDVQDAGFGNEGGVAGSRAVRPFLVKSLNGLQLIQRLRDSLLRRGWDLSFEDIGRRAAAAPEGPAIDPSDPAFFNPPDVVDAIAAACGPETAADPGASARAIYAGLAAETGAACAALEGLLGRPLAELRVCGGGAQDVLLCRLIADATGKPVVAGPIEASAWGNAVVQLIAMGELASVDEGRELVERSIRGHRPGLE